MHLKPNTIEGLKWGLKNFDGIETDLRLTKENQLVIHHDPVLKSGEPVKGLTINELKSKGVPPFRDFIQDPEVLRLAKNGKRFLLELKPNCSGKAALTKEIAGDMTRALKKELDEAGFPFDQITVISFQEELLLPLVEEFQCAPLLPTLNECEVVEISGFTYLKLLGKFFKKRLPSYLKSANKKGFRGVYTAREYFVGGLSRYHGSYRKKLQIASDLEIELGTNLGSVEKEPEFPELLRVTDLTFKHPRHAKKGEGPIIAHRGTGTKGVTLE